LPEPEIYVPAGDDVAVYGRLKGRAKTSGAAIDLPIVHVWTMQLGRATRFAAFIDTPAMLKALAGK